MAKLPVLSGRQLIQALERAGFQVMRQKGSHVSLRRKATKLWFPSITNLPMELCSAFLNSAASARKISKTFLRGDENVSIIQELVRDMSLWKPQRAGL